MHLYKKILQIGKCFLYFNTIVSSYLSPREEFGGGLITSFAWLILAFTLQQLLCLLLAISFPETYNNAVRMYMFWIVDFYSVEVVKNKSSILEGEYMGNSVWSEFLSKKWCLKECLTPFNIYVYKCIKHFEYSSRSVVSRGLGARKDE